MSRLRTHSYLGMKLVNLGLATVLSFTLIFVMVRVLPVSGYSAFVLVTAIGSYVMASDLGFSAVIYDRVRAAHLHDRAGETRSLATTALLTYGLIALAGQVIGTGLIALLPNVALTDKIALAAYLFSILLSLPWTVVRVVANAIDRFIAYEAVEISRRTMLIVMALAMLTGQSLMTYAVAALLVWAVVLAILLPQLRGVLDVRHAASLFRPREALSLNRASLGWVSLFSGLEFVIYNHPYVLIPALFGVGLDLAIFDVFFKVTRFGAMAYSVANEGLLPQNTRAIREGDARGLKRNIAFGLLVSGAAAAAAIAIILLFGDQLFAKLLAGKATIVPEIRYAMCVILVLMAVQATAGTLLLNTGKGHLLARIAVGMTIVMGLAALAALILRFDFPDYMVAYVAAFGIGAVTYVVLLWRNLARFGAGGRW